MDQNEEKKVGIPESITINGVTYTVKDTPELQMFIQEVAKVEKAKLYTQFENLKAQIANLNKVKVVPDATPATDLDALVEKLRGTFITKEDLKETLAGTVKEVVQPVLAATEQSRQEELSQFREKLIQDNIDKCIPDLVKGETKEELLASLQESIRIRTAYPSPSSVQPQTRVVDPLITQQAQAQRTAQQYNPTPTETAAPTPPATPRRPAPEVAAPANVKAMPMSEFASRREQLEQQLRATYGG